MLTHRKTTILGDVPHDWPRELLAKVLVETKGGDWGDDEGEASARVLRSTNFTNQGTLNFDDVAVRHFSSRKVATFALRENDILLERSGGGPTQPVGRVGLLTKDLEGYWFSNFVQLLRPNKDEINAEYLGWLLFELNRSGVVERLQHQTTQMRNLDFRDYLRVYLPRPPANEQTIIAQILWLADEVIRAASKQLNTAGRLKTALIQQLFTCGLPGKHTRFMQTKIGEIPQGWELVPLGVISTIASGIALNPERAPKLYPHQYLTVIHVQRERLELSDVRYLELFPEEMPDALLEEGDILLVEGHANASEIGRAALATKEVAGFAYQNHIFRVRLNGDANLNRLFLLGVLNSERVRRHWVATCNTSSGLNTINRRGLRRLLIQRPLENEQEQIADLMKTANENIKASINQLRAVQKLRSSLLQNLLTGRVRVKT